MSRTVPTNRHAAEQSSAGGTKEYPSLKHIYFFVPGGGIAVVKRLLVAAVGLVGTNAFGDDIVTLKGTKYQNASVTRVEPDGLMVMHATGIVKVPFTELSEDLRQKYSYNPERAVEHARESAAKQQAFEENLSRAKKVKADRDAVIAMKSAAEADARANQRAIASFSLEAREVGTGSTGYTSWRTDYGSYDRTTVQNKRILVEVRDLRRTSADCTADVYFVGSSAQMPGLFIYAHEPVELKMSGGIAAQATVAAPAIAERVLNLEALRRRYARGARMEGWFVVGRVGEQVFGVKGPLASSATTLISVYQAGLKEQER